MPLILLMEQDPNLRHTLALVLRGAGYAVDACHNRDDALRRLGTRPFNLVLIDDNAASADFSCLRQICVLQPQAKLLILLSNNKLPAGLKDYLPCSCQFLHKPFCPSYMLQQIELLLNQSESHPPINQVY